MFDLLEWKHGAVRSQETWAKKGGGVFLRLSKEKTATRWVCVSPLSSERHRCQPGCRGRGANLNACIVILLAGSACYWANLHAPPQKRRSKLLFFFSSNRSQLFKALQLRLFSDYSFVLASAQKKEVPFQKRTNWMMGIFIFFSGISLNRSEPNVWVIEQCFQQRVSQLP